MIPIPLTKPWFTADELNEIRSVLHSGWVSNGPKCTEFEDAVKNFTGAPHAVAVSSCTAALHLALKSLGIGSGDEVIVADFSFPATGLSVLHAGATPVFCDVDRNTYNIDPDKIEKCITKNTKAIIPVHTFGNPCEMDKIMEVARHYGLFVIEDAACALGSTYRNTHMGLFGDVGCFSFHARKGITTGEGGMIITKSEFIATYIRKMSMFGVESAYNRKAQPVFRKAGYNYKMSDIAAAVGVSQMKKLPDIIKKKRKLAMVYRGLFEGGDIIIPQIYPIGGEHVYQSFVGTTKERDLMVSRLASRGIETGIGTYAQHCQAVFNSSNKCVNSETLFRNTISLPIYYEMTEEDIYYIYREVIACR